MDEKIYYEDDRAHIRSSLTSEQHVYVTTLEDIACKAYHLWKNTPYANKPSPLTVYSLNEIYDALAKVDFMEGDELRDQDK